MGRKLRFIQQSITDLCKRLDDLNVELTRASVEDQELFLSEIKNVRKALDDDLAEVYIKGYFYVEISMSHILNQKVFQDQHSNFNSSLRNLSFILTQSNVLEGDLFFNKLFKLPLKLKEKARYFEARIKGINRELATMTDQEEKDKMQELRAAFIQKHEEVSFERRRLLLYKVKSTDSPWSDAFLDLIVTFDWI